jgi:hypothetical protein
MSAFYFWTSINNYLMKTFVFDFVRTAIPTLSSEKLRRNCHSQTGTVSFFALWQSQRFLLKFPVLLEAEEYATMHHHLVVCISNSSFG